MIVMLKKHANVTRCAL